MKGPEFSTKWRHRKLAAICEPRSSPHQETAHAGALISDFQLLELWKINVCCSGHPVHSVLLQLPKVNKTTIIHPLIYLGRTLFTFFFWILFFFFFLSFVFLGPHVQHMEVPRPEVESELQPPSYPQPQQLRIWAVSATYSTAHNNTGSPTHWARPDQTWLLMDTNRVC